MESASTPARVRSPIDVALLAAAAQKAAAVLGDADDPTASIDAAMGVLHAEIAGLTPSVFVLDHGRFWLVAQRGHSVVPDGIRVVSGVMGRAVRLGSPQLVPDVTADPDYFDLLPYVDLESNPPRVRPRTIVDLAAGLDLRNGRGQRTWSAQVQVTNLTNQTALYNFQSVFVGTRLVAPRTVSVKVARSF